MEVEPVTGVARQEEREKKIEIFMVSLFSAIFFYVSIDISLERYFWMDEVMTLLSARFSSAWEVIFAPVELQFSPPLYHVIVHFFLKLGGNEHLLSRLPSILGVFGAAVAIFMIVRPRLGRIAAAASFGFILSSNLFEFAINARPYALMVAVFAFILLLWVNFEESKRKRLCAFGIGALLVAGLYMHFFFAAAACAFAALELIWTVRNKKIRWALWVAMLCAALMQFFTLSVLEEALRLVKEDAFSPKFYAKPDLKQLPNFYRMIFLGKLNAVIVANILLYAGILLVRFEGGFKAILKSGHTAPKRDRVQLWIIAGVSLSVPVMALLFSYVVHILNFRYVICAVLGAALVFAIIVGDARKKTAIALMCVVIFSISLFCRYIQQDGIKDSIVSLKEVAGDSPIVIGEGLLFIELWENAPPEIKSRIVFLSPHPEVPVIDPTNAAMVRRLLPFLHDAKFYGPEEFLAKKENFYFFTRRGSSVDSTWPYLKKKKLLSRLERHEGKHLLYHVDFNGVSESYDR